MLIVSLTARIYRVTSRYRDEEWAIDVWVSVLNKTIVQGVYTLKPAKRPYSGIL
jgi:hypothetical protein